MKKTENINVIASLAALYILWGSTYLGIRIAMETIPPFLMAGTRFFMAGSLLYIFLRMRGARIPGPIEWGGGAIVGAFLLLGGNGGVVFAEQWVASGLAALGASTVPLWTVLFSRIWGRWPTRLEWAGVIIGFAGVGLLNLEGGLRAHPLGAAALIFASMCWSFGSAWSRHLPLPKGSMAGAIQMMTGGLMLTAAGYVTGERIGNISWRSACAVLYLMIFGSVIGFSAYTYVIRKVRPALATSYAYVNPVVAVGLGVLFAGERVTAAGVIAMLIIITAIALVLMGQKQED